MIPLRDDNPAELRPVVTVGLIALCVLGFVVQRMLSPRSAEALVYSLGLIPAVLLGHRELEEGLRIVPAPVTLLTSMFLHAGILHLAGTILYLWIFGDNVEDRMGHGRFIVFYLLCGLAAALAQALPNPESVVPMIGASGAISGVLGAYLRLFPRASVLVIVPIFIIPYALRLPALFVLGLWFVAQLVSSLLAGSAGGVAFRAHLGGFLAGVLLVRLFERRTFRNAAG
jgi:membrane associated rhomboid family serine protease